LSAFSVNGPLAPRLRFVYADEAWANQNQRAHPEGYWPQLQRDRTAILEQAFRMEDALRKPLERRMKAEGLTLAEAVTRLVERGGMK